MAFFLAAEVAPKTGVQKIKSGAMRAWRAPKIESAGGLCSSPTEIATHKAFEILSYSIIYEMAERAHSELMRPESRNRIAMEREK